MRLHPTTIEVRRMRIDRIDHYYQTVKQQLKDGVTVYIPVRSALFEQQVKAQLKRRSIECDIKEHYTFAYTGAPVDKTLILKPAN